MGVKKKRGKILAAKRRRRKEVERAAYQPLNCCNVFLMPGCNLRKSSEVANLNARHGRMPIGTPRNNWEAYVRSLEEEANPEEGQRDSLRWEESRGRRELESDQAERWASLAAMCAFGMESLHTADDLGVIPNRAPDNLLTPVPDSKGCVGQDNPHIVIFTHRKWFTVRKGCERATKEAKF